ncbi:MAG: hypothetical protein LBK28_02045, partial [Propionibacteriaceae bacterium]|nr:hypothetical protein [Propionibacteriaceae bacterium]
MMTSTLLSSPRLAGDLLRDDPLPPPPLPLPSLPDDVHYRLGSAGRCSGRPNLFIFASDDSGSVVGAGGNDPLSRRYAEARLAIRTLARACRCGQEMASVAHWDKSLADVLPTNLNRLAVRRVLAGLVQPPDSAGTSDLGPVLVRIERLVRRRRWARYLPHLVVMSDFELTDPDPSGVFDQLNQFPGRVTALVLGVEPDPR